MDAGSLVTITRASIGVPLGTIGLVTEVITLPPPVCGDAQFTTYIVKVFVDGSAKGRRYLARDLEKLS